MTLANILEQARTHASTEQRVENIAGMALRVSNWVGGNANAKLHLFQRLLIAQHDAGHDLRLGRLEGAIFGPGFKMLEVLDDQIHKLIVIEMSSGGYDNVAWGEAVRISIEHGLALEFLYGFFRTQDRLA